MRFRIATVYRIVELNYSAPLGQPIVVTIVSIVSQFVRSSASISPELRVQSSP